MRFPTLAISAVIALAAASVGATTPPCAPCAGVLVTDPYAALPGLAAAPAIEDGGRLYVAWDLPLDAAATPAAGHALAAAGATPWLRLVFATAAPVTEHLAELQAELDTAAALASPAIPRAHYQVVWRPASGETVPSATEYAFLFKRAAVALTGADPDARVITQALPPDTAWLSAFYGQEVAAYADGLAFAPAPEATLRSALEAATGLDPGKLVLLDGEPLPEPAGDVLAAAARAAAAGFAVSIFRVEGAPAAEVLRPLVVLANEFRGELSLDRGTTPEGLPAWSFVRGEDLALRVVVDAPEAVPELVVRIPDPQLRDVERVLLATGEVIPLYGVRRTGSGLEVHVSDPAPSEVLRVTRASIEELEGIAEEVLVETDRQIPVEEILRRLQAFEDAQNRRVRHWQAINSTTLIFQAASGVGAFEATFEGEIFLRPGQPFDWAWQNFYVNGVKWRGKTIPELPLIQPEKAAAMPLEILFTKEYRYRLLGTEQVAGRDCWAIEFEPSVPLDGKTLFRGTVWVDRETSARVRTRGIQLGLTGEVLSNEETLEYTPVDAAGAPAAWGSPGAFVLPLRTTGQQILSVVNAATVVEREVRLTRVIVNGPEFDQRREEVLASASTMVRDTDKGLRYLVPDAETAGERVVKEGYDTSRLLLLGGVFYDDSLDYPLPLAGVNYFDLEFGGAKRQLNAFFGGVLGVVSYADPRFLGTKLDLGVDAFAIAVASSNEVFRDGVEFPEESVEVLPARVTLNLGFPIGSFTKVSTSYKLSYSHFSTTDDTAPEFVLPEDHLEHRASLGVQFSRQGYRLNLQGAWHTRSEWDFWGLPGNPEFDPAAEDFTTWEVAASKNWYLSGFKKIGLELDAFGGSDLDRFSKYQFGFFGGNRVHGYQIGKVRAEEGYAAHLTYGFEVGNLLRLDAVGDAVWATDEATGLDQELLAGVGLQGTLVGPWETLIQIDVGTPVDGPDDGVVAYVVFLKLFD